MAAKTYVIQLPASLNSPQAAWAAQLTALCNEVPSGVTVSVTDHAAVVTIADVVECLRGVSPDHRLHVNARYVLFWLVEHLPGKIVVLCTTCKLRRSTAKGGCRCADKGHRVKNTWVYTFLSSPDTGTPQQNWWCIGEGSLLALRDEDIAGPGLGPVKKANILTLLHWLRRGRAH